MINYILRGKVACYLILAAVHIIEALITSRVGLLERVSIVRRPSMTCVMRQAPTNRSSCS
jgi:hypothetical protein